MCSVRPFQTELLQAYGKLCRSTSIGHAGTLQALGRLAAGGDNVDQVSVVDDGLGDYTLRGTPLSGSAVLHVEYDVKPGAAERHRAPFSQPRQKRYCIVQ